MSNLGKIIIPASRAPELHELSTAKLFTGLGFDVLFLEESRGEGQRSADVEINGVVWEIKSPTGESRRTVERQFHRASGQSQNIILDSRRSKINTQTFRKAVHREWEKRLFVRRLILIEHDGKMIDFHR